MADTEQYLRILADDIHTVVCATIDAQGHPVTRAIDVMLADGMTFYFLTAKGKDFYQQLVDGGYIAMTGMTGGEGYDRAEASLHTKAISVRGAIRCIGTEKLDEIFAANPYMAQIYPTEASREALVVFCMERGQGEFFDLSTKPITRASFAIGADHSAVTVNFGNTEPYLITDTCIGCGVCLGVCPQDCIDDSAVPFVIEQEHCLHCGNCYNDCPVGAIVWR